ncbi:NUDIX hydrolase [Patescibacteria group bacterium]|nr:NUDIX hydrolase [Patescibacteria group bacterium]
MNNDFFDVNQQLIKRKKGDQVFWRISAYGLIRSPQKKILLVVPQYNKDIWILPGGEINLDESVEEGIIRECYEETGYRVKIKGTKPFYVGETNFYCMQKFCHSINLIYEANLTSLKQDKEVINSLEPNEVERVEWVPLEEIGQKKCHFVMYPAIKILKNKIN